MTEVAYVDHRAKFGHIVHILGEREHLLNHHYHVHNAGNEYWTFVDVKGKYAYVCSESRVEALDMLDAVIGAHVIGVT